MLTAALKRMLSRNGLVGSQSWKRGSSAQHSLVERGGGRP
jgi:hypothetical protein